MAKKTTTNTTVEEAVADLQLEGVTPESVNIAEAKPEPIKRPTIIAKKATPFRTKPLLESKYIVGQMPVGVSYEIVQEIDTVIYGKFYKLSNGYYITKSGSYSIN